MGFTDTNAYAQPSDFIGANGNGGRYDCRVIADLVSDTDNRLGDATDTPTIQAALSTNQTILDILADASGQINTYVLAGGRYTIGDLEALTDTDQQVLIRLTCSLAYGYLCMRRGALKPDDLPIEYKQAMDMLDMIRNGATVFNVQADIDAGVANSFFPTITQYKTLNLFRDSAASARYFGNRLIQRG